uniref:Uncharacterized protein n=1 Tax=Arundo donax TaxID=35708 RepID=A0A0A9GM99_ARUDO
MDCHTTECISDVTVSVILYQLSATVPRLPCFSIFFIYIFCLVATIKLV